MMKYLLLLLFCFTVHASDQAGSIGAGAGLDETAADLLYLRLDGGNSPSAAISWNSQDLNDLNILEFDGTRQYEFRNSSAGLNALAVQRMNSGAPMRFDIYAVDGDDTDNVTFRTFSFGNRDATVNANWMAVGYNSGAGLYDLRTICAGTGCPAKNIRIDPNSTGTGTVEFANDNITDVRSLELDDTSNSATLGVDANGVTVPGLDVQTNALTLSQSGNFDIQSTAANTLSLQNTVAGGFSKYQFLTTADDGTDQNFVTIAAQSGANEESMALAFDNSEDDYFIYAFNNGAGALKQIRMGMWTGSLADIDSIIINTDETVTATNDVDFLSTASFGNYQITFDSSRQIFQETNAGAFSKYEFRTEAEDGTDANYIVLNAQSGANEESLFVGFDSSEDDYFISTFTTGSGADKPIRLGMFDGAVANVDQIILQTDDTTDIKGLTLVNDMDGGGFLVSNIADPVSAQDAATKTWTESNFNNYVHPNHTGEVTSVGDGAQTLDKTAISNRSDVTMDATDILVYGDTTDSDNLKKGAIQDILDLMDAQRGRSVDTVSTTDNSLITIRTFTAGTEFTDNDVIDIDAECVGMKDDGTQALGQEVSATFRKDGAAATVQVGIDTDIYKHVDDGSWDVQYALSGSNILLQVRGGIGDNVNWKCDSHFVAEGG